jgi:hypothetical protein
MWGIAWSVGGWIYLSTLIGSDRRGPILWGDSLPQLEAERSQILQQFTTTLGDLRPGSICAVTRRCGKPTCHCAKPSDPGHDPQLRLTRKVGGKTIAESFPSPAAWHKAQAEIAEYHLLPVANSDLIDKLGVVVFPSIPLRAATFRRWSE